MRVLICSCNHTLLVLVFFLFHAYLNMCSLHPPNIATPQRGRGSPGRGKQHQAQKQVQPQHQHHQQELRQQHGQLQQVQQQQQQVQPQQGQVKMATSIPASSPRLQRKNTQRVAGDGQKVAGPNQQQAMSSRGDSEDEGEFFIFPYLSFNLVSM